MSWLEQFIKLVEAHPWTFFILFACAIWFIEAIRGDA